MVFPLRPHILYTCAVLHNKNDYNMHAFLCVAFFALAPAAGAAPAVFAIDRLSSIAGPIFRTQPAPWPAPSLSDGYTAVTETDLVPQPAIGQSDDQTAVRGTDFVPQPTLGHSDDQTVVTETGSYATNPPQQQLQSTQSLDDGNIPQKIQPPSSNKTSEDMDAYAHYCDQEDEYIDDYIPFFCCILIILSTMLVILALLGHFDFQYSCPGMKKNSLESLCSLTRNS